MDNTPNTTENSILQEMQENLQVLQEQSRRLNELEQSRQFNALGTQPVLNNTSNQKIITAKEAFAIYNQNRINKLTLKCGAYINEIIHYAIQKYVNYVCVVFNPDKDYHLEYSIDETHIKSEHANSMQDISETEFIFILKHFGYRSRSYRDESLIITFGMEDK
jgi:hypothetical protein